MSEVTRVAASPAGRRSTLAAAALLVPTLGAAVATALGGYSGGRASAIAAGGGAVGAIVIQGVAWLVSRSGSGSDRAFLSSLGWSSAVRWFGGVILVTIAIVGLNVAVVPFLCGFGGLYAALEVIVDVGLIARESGHASACPSVLSSNEE